MMSTEPVLGSHLVLPLTIFLATGKVLIPLDFGFFMGKLWVRLCKHGEG